MQCRKFSLFKFFLKKIVTKSDKILKIKIKVFQFYFRFRFGRLVLILPCTSRDHCRDALEQPSIASKDGQSWIETLFVFLRAFIQLIQLMLSKKQREKVEYEREKVAGSGE